MGLVIKNGHLVNPLTAADGIVDIRIADGKVAEIAEEIAAEAGDEVIDAKDCFVVPGLIDLHVHFRDPGQTQKEDVETGSLAAAAGGYTTVCAMPNTTPVADSPETITYVQDKADQFGKCKVYQVGAITKGMRGEELVDFKAMTEAGCKAFSEDGKSVMNSRLMRNAMRKTAELSVPILDHCEDIELVEGGVMNAGKRADELGLPGISNAVENIIASRDIMLAEETGAKLHLCHCSTQESVDLVWDAKMKGLKVSGEVCPHHFLLTEDDIPDADAAEYKMNPPLRTKDDLDELVWALSDNIMDVISTDHAPHTAEEKGKGFLNAPFGIVGLETALPLTYTHLVKTGILTMQQFVAKTSINPAKVLGIDRGDISVGKVADITIFDPSEEYEIHASEFKGKAKNMPYEGRTVCGKVKYTILEGKITFTSR